MKTAIIGYTGFVGGNLCEQYEFNDFYNSKSIKDIAGKKYDLLVCTALPAAKWIANKEPEADLQNMEKLAGSLDDVEAAQVILVSTVDVYPRPLNVDEDSPIDINECHAYGKHRLMFEQKLAEKFDNLLIVRLPGLFGNGLKKNAIYDFLNDNETHKIHCDAVFQFYGLDNLWADISKALADRLKLVNFATEPVSIAEIAEYAFEFTFSNRPDYQPPKYNFKTINAKIFNGCAGYMYSKPQILSQIKAYVQKMQG